MTQKLPDDPKFIQNLTSVQKWLATIALSMFFTTWITSFDWVINFFKPDFVKALTFVRMSIALSGIVIMGFVGIPQIKKMIDSLIEYWEIYKKISEIKEKGKE